ncbi:beta-N-acetylhexosaminidase [Chitinophagaceae bacterium LB-8]|uniref:beta-N-acetylhexosaminidase n=1 Tax=Paraflavisolibacter caeni TaxID=2982496 RepID=A0A9X2XP02_9BACT|nr:beta-N-acetylhexosaminidase [Paraflavisolibacter caeni]MCU7550093.1 beta-N-acetylhexosaminidase [Paraflavisolibacter caeni]
MQEQFLYIWVLKVRFINGLLLISLFATSIHAQEVQIIPQPAHLTKKAGSFMLTKNTVIVIQNKEDKKSAYFLNSYLKQIYGFQLPFQKHATGKAITIFTNNNTSDKDKDAYTFESGPAGILIKGNTYAGTFYGMQTLIQLLPTKKAASLKIPSVYIQDEPRFMHRGSLLDVGRHFFPVAFIKKYIDYLALHKMNYFHWHLTDDPGWRIEIKKYPKLTEVGAWRNRSLMGRYPGIGFENKRYGGYYTQEQIKEIVQYAADRYITILPEIEMPGHSYAALASYPELGCSEGPYTVPEVYRVDAQVFCAGKEYTFEFLQNVLDEVLELFPSQYIHIGGDECPKDGWKTCPRCQARIKNEGLKDEHELQSYFIQRIEKYLNSKGRTLIGWDDILEGGLAPNAVVMSWRGESGGITAAKEKHKVIMTPSSHLYFDYSQVEREDSVTIGWFDYAKNENWFTPIEKVYNYEPIPKELSPEESKYVLGAQGNVWTEYITNPRKVEYMLFPRISAISEVLWTPKEKKNWNDFEKRLIPQLQRYDLWKVNYSKAHFGLEATVLPQMTLLVLNGNFHPIILRQLSVIIMLLVVQYIKSQSK